ncbi:MAG: dTMP kinase [Phycisphaerales bacterium]|nr:MAG: dTMP kinase [Phycisphaerales bacterium]
MNNINLQKRFSGKFIVLDGPDGCGKSTQTELLAEWLRNQGVVSLSFRDPGGTAIGERIRAILLSPENGAMSTQTELLLYMAARSQLWSEKIRPCIEQGRCVVLDRWLSSSCAYQGFAGGFGIDRVVRIADDSLERVWPDVTIVLDVDLQTGSRRLSRELDRMEQKGDGYHERVREGFLQLAKDRDDIVVVDGGSDIETVHKKVVEEVERFF